MAKVKIHGMEAVERNIQDTFERVRSSVGMRKEVGLLIQERIKAEIRRGRPLNDTRKFPDLRESSVNIRERLAKINQTHKTFKPNRSNTTFTGQLVDSIRYILRGRGVIDIEVTNIPRRPIKTLGKVGSQKSNKQIQRDLKDLGFILFTAKGLDNEPRIGKRVNSIIKKYIRRAIKVNFGS